MRNIFNNLALTLFTLIIVAMVVLILVENPAYEFVTLVVLAVLGSSFFYTSRCPKCGETYGISGMNYVVFKNCCKQCANMDKEKKYVRPTSKTAPKSLE